MRILYLTQYFVTPDQPGGLRHYAHTRYLQKAGNEVTVITTYVLHKQRSIPEQYRGKRLVKEEVDGVTVYKVYSSPKFEGFIGRIINYLSFMLNALWAGVCLKGSFDVVYASSPPLFVGLAGYLLGLQKRSQFVLEVRDLWPKSVIDLGFLKNPLIIWLATRLELFLYRKAWKIVAVTEGIQGNIRQRISKVQKVELVPNGVDTELFEAVDRATCQELRQTLGGDFIAMYAGAHGKNNSLDMIIEAAAELRDEPGIRFALIGEGDQTNTLRKRCSDLGLVNVSFLGLKSKRETVLCLLCANVLLWPVNWSRENPSLKSLKEGACPNKLFDYLAAGKPIISTAPPSGEGARLIRDLEAGLTVEPTPQALGQAVHRLYQATDLYQHLGPDSSKKADLLQEYSRREIARKLTSILNFASRKL
jgi:glycosyltransferase involved in cell wall biosynthesis